MLRIALIKKSGFTRVDRQKKNPLPEYPRLVRLIQKHLSPITASVLAIPIERGDDDGVVEWSTVLSGQPVRLDTIPPKQQASARELLKDRLASISKLADELPNVDPDAIGLQETLRHAVAYPGDQSVYVVNGQPVVTFWGHRDINVSEPELIPHTVDKTPDQPPAKKLRFPWRLILGTGITLLLLALLVWLALQYKKASDDYDNLLDQIEAAAGQCETLENILNSNSFLEQPEGKFIILKQSLIQEIKECEDDRAYRELVSQIDAAIEQCGKLEYILNENPLLQRSEERFAALKQGLIEKIKTCKENARYRELRAQIEAAAGHCEKLEEIHNSNPLLQQPTGRYLEMQQKLIEQIKSCKEDLLYKDLIEQIEKVNNDCAKLEAILNTNQYLQQPEGRFIQLRQQLTEQIKVCKSKAEIEDLKRNIEQSAHQCKKLESILGSDPRLQNPAGEYISIKQNLNNQIKICKANAKKDPTQLCPGERPIKLAPELVVVFDASGSMKLPMGTTAKSRKLRKQANDLISSGNNNFVGQILMAAQANSLIQQADNIDFQKFGKHNTRMKAAKKALSKMVKTIPSDVSTGLVILSGCPAKKIGFYPPQRRKRFVKDINSLFPRGGTPLANGLAKAGQMIDGVKKPATIVVISDGKESCDGKSAHCAVAKRLAANKPKLTINVVDILGAGAGNCLAKATKKGKVFTARNVKDLVRMTEKAGSTIAAPKHCKKR